VLLLLLQGEALTAMPDGRCLPAANYRDTVRPLRRMLKQMGRGCLTAGERGFQGFQGIRALNFKNCPASCVYIAELEDLSMLGWVNARHLAITTT
jgi:hypothetical protein